MHLGRINIGEKGRESVAGEHTDQGTRRHIGAFFRVKELGTILDGLVNGARSTYCIFLLGRALSSPNYCFYKYILLSKEFAKE